MSRLFVLLMLLPAGASAVGYDRIEVLAVGISKYDHGQRCRVGRKASRGKWCNLPNGHVDAVALKKALEARKWLSPINVVVLPQKKSTRKGILTALRKAAERAKKGKSLLIFYFTGHGETQGDAGFLIPREGTRSDPDSWLSMAKLKSVLGEYRTVQHQMVILGSCFGGKLFRSDGWFDRIRESLPTAMAASERFINKEVSLRAQVAFTAGRAKERVPDGQPGKGSRYGRALAGAFAPRHGLASMPADFNGDRCVTHVELAAWLDAKGGGEESNRPQFGRLGEPEEGTVLFCEAGAGVERPVEKREGVSRGAVT